MDLMNRPGVYKGQLKIHIEQISGQLKIHVIEAENLLSKWQATCNPYVQVSVIPQETSIPRWTSETIFNSHAPNFQQTAFIELLPGDDNKRLMISTWNMDVHKNCSEFLGCMSFGIKHLKSKAKRKPIQGYYYLLSEDLGFRKHLVVPSSGKSYNHSNHLCHSNQASIARPALEGASPKDDKHKKDYSKLEGFKSDTLVITKCSSGYGFTVKNSCPVRVGRVKGQGPSEQAGLQKGDFIIRINGQNVSMATATTVAEIIRLSTKYLVVDICRPAPKSCDDTKHSHNSLVSETSTRASQSGTSYQSSNLTSRYLHQSVDSCYRSENGYHSNEENIPPSDSIISKLPPRLEPLGEQIQDKKLCQKPAVIGSKRQYQNETIDTFPKSLDSTHVSDFSIMNKASKMRRDCKLPAADGNSDSECTKWDPDISIISTTESLRNRHVYSHCDLTVSSPSSINDKNHNNSQTKPTWKEWIETSVKTYQSPWQPNTRDSLWHHRDHSDKNVDKAMLGSDNVNDSALGSSRSSSNQSNHSNNDDVIKSAILNLVDCERQFSTLMCHGIYQYSRPLRHALLTPQQHINIFQNIEKISVLSQYIIHQLTAENHSPEPDVPINCEHIADVYSMKVQLLCSTYQIYFEGLTSALQTLNELQTNSNLRDFINKQNCTDLSIESFLQYPQRHLVTMTGCFLDLIELLPSHSEERTVLFSVVQAIKSQCH